jgi:hypothetical protein
MSDSLTSPRPESADLPAGATTNQKRRHAEEEPRRITFRPF